MKNKKVIIITSILFFLIAVIALVLILKSPKSTGQININTDNYSQGKEFSLGKAKSLLCKMDIPNDGRITLYVADYTAYIEENKKLKMQVTIKDDNNEIVDQKTVGTNQSYDFTTQVKKSTYNIEIKLINATSKDNIVYLSWGYAPIDANSNVKVDGKTATSLINEKGVSTFSVDVEKNMLVEIGGGDACIPESSFEFSVLDKDDNKIVSNVRVEKTEWQSRKVFLPKGQYKIEMKNLIKNSVAKCTIKSLENYTQVQTDLAEFNLEKEKPIYIGFSKNTSEPQKIKFKATGDNKVISVAIVGNDTYYDCVSSAKFVVVDSSGKKVFDQVEEESFELDISKYSGDYFIYISKKDNDNFVAKLEIK